MWWVVILPSEKSTAQTICLLQQCSSQSNRVCTDAALRKRDVLNCAPSSPIYLASHIPMAPKLHILSSQHHTSSRWGKQKYRGNWPQRSLKRFLQRWVVCSFLPLDLSMKHKGIRQVLAQLLWKTQLIKREKKKKVENCWIKCVQQANEQTLMLGYLTHH